MFNNIIIALVLYIEVFFCAPIVARLYDMPILIPVMRVMGLGFFVYMTKSVVNAKISRNMQFKKFFFATIGGTIMSAVVGVWMALNGFGPWALVAQQLTNAVIDTIILLIISKIKFVFVISKQRLIPLIKYSWKLFVSSVISNVFIEVKPLIVGLQYTPNDLAYYNKAENYPRVIATSIDSTLSSVLLPVIKEVQDEKEKVLRIIRRFFSLSSYLIFPAMFGFAAISTQFVSVVLTDKWLPSVPYLVAFCYTYMLEFLTLGTNQTLKAIGRTDLVLKIELAKKAIALLIILLVVLLAENPIFFAYAGMVCALCSVFIETMIVRKAIDYKYRYLIKDIGFNFMLSAIMFAGVYCIGFIPLNNYALLPMQIVVGGLFYAIASALTNNESFKYYLNILQTRFKKKKLSEGN
ncbi:MAG: oligosaccharide flippase family protein [Clostridia bacterium]|nr:oligosaccharide flippase family protein [Clostridia bacterium]